MRLTSDVPLPAPSPHPPAIAAATTTAIATNGMCLVPRNASYPVTCTRTCAARTNPVADAPSLSVPACPATTCATPWLLVTTPCAGSREAHVRRGLALALVAVRHDLDVERLACDGLLRSLDRERVLVVGDRVDREQHLVAAVQLQAAGTARRIAVVDPDAPVELRARLGVAEDLRDQEVVEAGRPRSRPAMLGRDVQRAGAAVRRARAGGCAVAGDEPAVSMDALRLQQRPGLSLHPDGHRRAGSERYGGRNGECERRPAQSEELSSYALGPPLSTRAYLRCAGCWSPGLRAYHPRLPGDSASPVASRRMASPITVAGPRRMLAGFPSQPTLTGGSYRPDGP